MNQCFFFNIISGKSSGFKYLETIQFFFERHLSGNSMGKEKARKVCGFCLFIVSLAAV